MHKQTHGTTYAHILKVFSLCPSTSCIIISLLLRLELNEIQELSKIDYLSSFRGVSNCWTGIWNEMVEWKMEWNN